MDKFISSIAFYINPNADNLNDYLLNHKDLSDKKRKSIINYVCTKTKWSIDIVEIIEYAYDKKIDLTEYNISDLIFELCKRNDIGCIIRVSKCSNIFRKSDLDLLTQKVYDNDDMGSAMDFIDYAKESLSEDNFSLLIKLLCKHCKDQPIYCSGCIYKLIKEYGTYLSDPNLKNLILAIPNTRHINTIIYLSMLPIMNQYLDELVNLVCVFGTLKDMQTMAMKNENINDYDPFVLEFCRKERLNADAIKEFAVNVKNLSDVNISNLTLAMIKTDSEYEILEYAIDMMDRLSPDDVTNLTNYYINTQLDIEIICDFLIQMKNLSEDNINSLATKIKDSHEVEYIYRALENVPNIKSDLKKEMIDKIILSRNLKYICLTAIFVDNTLISRIFITIEGFLNYINKLDLTDEEISKIHKKLFGNDGEDSSMTIEDDNLNKLILEINNKREDAK